MRKPRIFKSGKRKAAEKRARVIREAKDRYRRMKSNGHNPPGSQVPSTMPPAGPPPRPGKPG